MGYIFPFIIGAISMVGVLKGGIWAYSGFIFIFAIHPGLDFIFNKVKAPHLKGFLRDYIQALLYVIFPFLVLNLFVGLKQIEETTSVLKQVGIILSTGVVLGAVGVTSAHELVHRPKRWERLLGFLNLSLCNFCQFKIFHVDIHHKHVGTKFDPATAKKNQNIYSYWIHALFTEYKLAWNFEKQAVGLSLFKNELIHALILQLFLCIIIFKLFSLGTLLAWLCMSLIAILLLETVDYIEHYGLERKELKPGIFEVVKPKHSWDTYTYFTNIALFNLGFHSHHHTRSQLPFTELKENEEAMQLPFGYSAMVICALIPVLWFKIMNNRCQAVFPDSPQQ